LSHVDHRARCRRRPRREAFLLLLSFSSALFFFARRSSLVAVVVVVVVVLVVCAGLLRAPEQLRWRSSLITSTRSVRIIIILPPSIVAVAVAARDCFALPKSFYVILCRPVRGIASRSRAASLALIIDNIDSVCAHHHHYIDSACAQDCFALPSSFANKTKGPAFFVFKISRTLRYLGGKTTNRQTDRKLKEEGLVEGKSKKIL
jgi:hypothetical protein